MRGNKLMFHIGNDSYAAQGEVHPERSARCAGAGRRGAEFGAGFGDRSTKALAAQK